MIPRSTPHVLSVRPPHGSPVPGRLDRDIEVVRGGIEAGRRAVHAALAPVQAGATAVDEPG